MTEEEQKYEKTVKLGEGTYGVVYKAKKKSDNNICVIKKLVSNIK